MVIFFMESFLQMCFEGKWLQKGLRADKNESRSLLAVEIQGHQRGGFCIVPMVVILHAYSAGGLDCRHALAVSLRPLSFHAAVSGYLVWSAVQQRKELVAYPSVAKNCTNLASCSQALVCNSPLYDVRVYHFTLNRSEQFDGCFRLTFYTFTSHLYKVCLSLKKNNTCKHIPKTKNKLIILISNNR